MQYDRSADPRGVFGRRNVKTEEPEVADEEIAPHPAEQVEAAIDTAQEQVPPTST